ncbi:hypothetical protein JAO73_07550 [Hymenobacter sp. BT523]|uniref:hypothetical protein n=1 Tax=Hymenobacter sp. BT523 TaxID=2795725 RepID=UPI0018EA9623|nr:hypothetical protein [Hymenobacter sp. BT523]MBJ6108857.1 hypothetical protein [Hymenobacter sp. BT523]
MRSITVHQPFTCAESWDAMAPTDVGRHCASCHTQVVDFTRMSDGEVVAFLSQYSPERRCGLFRDDQVGRPLLAAAQPLTGRRRWAVTLVLLLWSVWGLKARAQGAKPRASATKPTHATVPDSLFLVQGVVRNWLGIPKAGALVNLRGLRDSTDAMGHFRLLLPKRAFGVAHHITVRYWKERYGRNHLGARVRFDSTRTQPYHITLRKVINRNPGFF